MATLTRPQNDDPAAIRQAVNYAFDQIEVTEPWHVVGATGEPAFQNGWVNFGGAWATAAFYKDILGRVHIKGLVKNGTVPQFIFFLPPAYSPAEDLIFPVIEGTGVAARLDVFSQATASGGVKINSGNNAFISLNVSFRVV